MKLVSVRNNKARSYDEKSKSWSDKESQTVVNNEIVNTPEYNPDSVDICFEGTLTSAQLADTNLFKNGFVTSSDLASFGKSLADSNPKYRNRLQVNDDDDAKYMIVAKQVKGSTRKSKFRPATISNAGNDTKVTFVTVSIDTSEPLVACEVEGI
mgnify:CR=1 FL=1